MKTIAPETETEAEDSDFKPLSAQEAGNTSLYAGGTDNFGITKFDQYRTFGMFGVVTGEADVAELIGLAAAGALHNVIL